MEMICADCKKIIEEGTMFYSLDINYEVSREDEIHIDSSACIVVLCEECVNKVPLAKIMTYNSKYLSPASNEAKEYLSDIFRSYELVDRE